MDKEAADREQRVFLTAKLDRAWSALTRLWASVGADRFRDLMVDLPDALDEIHSPDFGAIAEFHELLGSDHVLAFLAEVTDAFETKNDPGALWAKWIEVVVARTLPFARTPGH